MARHIRTFRALLTRSAGVLLACAPLVLSSTATGAAEREEIRIRCEAAYIASSLYSPPPLFSEAKRENINISADTTRMNEDRSSWFEGDVLIEQHELRIRSDHAYYDSSGNSVTLNGNIHIDTPDMGFDASRGTIDLDTRHTALENTRFFIPETRLRGSADTITAASRQSSRLEDATLTSCPPDDVDWLLSAGSIDLDLVDEYGSARDVVLRFQRIPVLYTPYIEFPIGDRRRSGLLTPEVGSSSSRGFELVVPWYWNIAPNQDATLAPHYMRKRGMQLDTEYRYMTQKSTGQLNIDYLHEDRIENRERYSTTYQQNTRFDSNIRFRVDFQDVSDTEYFKDFSSSLFFSSTTHLNRNMNLVAGYDNWEMSALLQSWETIETSIPASRRPYRTLPKLAIQGSEEILGDLSFTLDSEWVNFEHESGTVVNGIRFRARPGLMLDLRGSGWYITPKIQYSHTQYNVTGGTGAPLDTETVNLPIRTLDSGLFLERTMDNGLLHTLEPRLFYVNIPFVDQSSLPLFDTSEPDFSFMQLFRENRFNGGDRVGDTDQVTASIRTRIIDPASGDEYLRASIGQIYYFDDRAVTLSGTPDTDTSSDIVAELGASIQNWSASAAMQWDTRTRTSEQQSISAQYKKGRTLVNAGYSRRLPSTTNKERLEQSDISFVAPLTRTITAIGRWNYSLEQERDLEVIAGLSYESCCWSIILAGQRNLSNPGGSSDEYNNSVLFQLVLKGLGASGGSASKRLQQSILGFDQDNL